MARGHLAIQLALGPLGAKDGQMLCAESVRAPCGSAVIQYLHDNDPPLILGNGVLNPRSALPHKWASPVFHCIE